MISLGVILWDCDGGGCGVRVAENPKWSLLVAIGSWGKMATGKGCVVTMIVEVRKYGI